MRVLFQLAICVCMIILAGGTIHYIHDRPEFGGGFLLICVWGILFVLIMATGAFDKPKGAKESGSAATEHLAHLEKRLTDIQSIVIALDEKLGRIEYQSQSAKTETT